MPGSGSQESWVPDGYEPRGVAAAVDGKSRRQPPLSTTGSNSAPAPAPPANLAALHAPAPSRRPTRAPAHPTPPRSPQPRPQTAPGRRRAPESRPQTRPAERLDINAAGLEELRALGLSITQSKRLLSQREERGGFGSLAELDALRGFPRDVIAALKGRARA